MLSNEAHGRKRQSAVAARFAGGDVELAEKFRSGYTIQERVFTDVAAR